MRKRDLVILLISAFAVFFSIQNQGSFSFREAWFHFVDDTYPIKHEGERLPPPIVTDLNGDGRNEVIIATHEAKLQVIEPYPKANDEGFKEVRTLAEVSLLPDKVRIAAGRRPVAMATGVVQRSYRDEKIKNKQILVVVTAGWNILCFDHNLKKLWEADAQENFPHGALHKEVSITISNYTLRHGDVGLVIVGGSMEVQPQLHLNPFEEELVAEKEAERHRHSAEDKEALDDKGAGKNFHFSYFAYAGMSGALRWNHNSVDFNREQSSSELIPQHNYKLDAAALHGRKPGEVECREYRESILGVMPHRWENRDDTQFELAHFRKHARKHHKKLPGKKGSKVSDHPPEETHVPGQHHGNKVAKVLGKAVEYVASSNPKKRIPYYPVISNYTTHWWMPNVVVAHLKEGIEAVHLASGRTVCKLWLQAGALHADINADGVLDHIQAVGGSGGERVVVAGGMSAMKPCWAVATSGIPATQELFNGSICKHSAFGAFQQGEFASRTFGRSMDGAPIEVIPPVLLNRYDERKRKRGLLSDVIFLTSRGEVTSYTAHFQRWQVVTGASWSTKGGFSVIGDKAVATLKAVALRKTGVPEVILVGGESEAVVLSSTGNHIASITLPSAPVHPILVEDFSGDGFNDLIICTSNGVYGFVQTHQPGASFFSFLVGCLIIVMAVIFVMQHLNAPKGKPKPLDQRSTDLW